MDQYRTTNRLVHFFNGWSRSTTRGRGSSSSRATRHTSRHPTRHTSWHSTTRCSTSCSAVEVLDDWIANGLNLLLLVLVLVLLSHLVGVQPLDALVALVLDLLLVRVGDGCVHHLLDVLLGQSALVVGDGDLVLFPSRLIRGRNIKDAICINVESDFNLRHSSGSRRDPCQLKLAKHVVVLGHSTLALVHLDQHTWLVVRVRRERLSLLSGNGCVPLDQGGHHATSCLNAKGKRADIKEKKVLHLLGLVAAQDGGLDCSSIRHGLIGVD